MLAYRVLDADPADPQYGLIEPAAVVHLEDGPGNSSASGSGRRASATPASTPTGTANPARVYLVPRNTVDLLRSLTTGER